MNYEAIAAWSQIAGSIAFTIALVLLFRKYAVPAVTAAQIARNEEIALTERRRMEAEVRLQKMKAALESAEADAAAIRESIQRQVEHERERLLAEAHEAGERTLHNAEGELQRSRNEARDALRIELIERALEIAREQADERLDRAGNARLVDRFIESLARSGIGGGARG